MKIIVLTCLLAALSAGSCKTLKKTADLGVPAEDTLRGNLFRKPIRDKGLFAATMDAIGFDTVYIARDTLHLITKKIQGCDEENFKLVWNGAMLKSLPPQTSLRLLQQADPSCKEQHHFHLTYNISPLRFKNESDSLDAPRMWSKITIVRLGGWKNLLKYEVPDVQR